MKIRIESNTYAYVIIRDFVLKPYEIGVLDDTGLVRSEYKSLVSLYDDKSIFLSKSDYDYLKSKLVISSDYDDSELRLLIANKVSTSSVGVADGVASLDGSGKVSSDLLPSYVDDVVEVSGISSITTGEVGKVYIDILDNLCYRWGGSSFIKITSGEVSSVAGKKGVILLVKSDVGLSNVDNTSDSLKEVLSATKLKKPVNIVISGDVSGSGTFAGNVDSSINVVLKPTGVVAGDYGDSVTVPSIRFNSSGLAVSGSTVPIRLGSTLDYGLVQLNDSLVSSSDVLALTAKQGKILKDLFDSSPKPSTFGLGSTLSVGSQELSAITLSNSFWSKSSIPLPSDSPFIAAFKLMNIGDSSWNTQLGFAAYSNTVRLRSRISTNGVFSDWDELALVKNVLSTKDPRIVNWDKNVSDSHVHSNKAILDGTTASYTSALDTKLQGLSNYVHPNSGVTAGTYKSVVVNSQGHITSGSNPTTLSGFGITDAYTKVEVDNVLGSIQTALVTILGDG